MSQNTLVYWHGIIGIPGKGPNWMEKYDPNRTIGELIHTMHAHKLGEQNKRIEIFKFRPGHLDKYDKNDLYWSHTTKLSEYLNIMGPYGKDLFLVYHII